MTDQPKLLDVEPVYTGRISWSALNSWLMCGEQFRLSYIEKVPRATSGALIGGRAVHETVEESEKQGWWRDPITAGPVEEPESVMTRFYVETFKRQLAEEVETSPYPIHWGGAWRNVRDDAGKEVKGDDGKPMKAREDALWWERSGAMMLRRYCEVRADDTDDGYTVDASEMKVATTLPSGRQLIGYIDSWLVIDDAGYPRIRDYKAGRVGGSSPIQHGIYFKAMRETMDIPRQTKGEVVYLRATDRRKRVETFDLEPLLPMVERKLADFERALDSGVYPLRESALCAGCGVRFHCIHGRTLEVEGDPLGGSY